MKKIVKLKTLVVALASTGLISVPQYSLANPSGGQVVAGNVTIHQETASKIGITQTTDKAIIDWQKFSIGANEHVQFYQPSASSVTLNRVVGQDPSQILGRLTANGQVFLVNPNGIYFGKNAQIDVAGLVASTHNIRNEDFLAGKYLFNLPGKPGAAVINEGQIRIADTGIAAFVAPSVANRGVIAAKLGRVTLASANGFTLDFTGDNLLSFMVNDDVAQTAFDLEGKQLTSFVENSGKIQANGGYVLMTAKAAENAIHGVINHSGVVEAQTVDQKNGEIILHAGKGNLVVSGSLDASAPNNGNGGFIETSGGNVSIDEKAKITTAAPFGNTGKWLIDPYDYMIAPMGGSITGAQLANYLASNNVVIQTATMGTALGNGDIHVNDDINWSAATFLSLQAERNVNIGYAINGNHPDSGLHSIGRLRITSTGSVNAGAVRYDVMNGIALSGPTTARGIYINATAINIESSYSGDAAAASLTPAEIATLSATRTGGTSWSAHIPVPWGTVHLSPHSSQILLDAPEGIAVNTALNSSHIKATKLTLFSWVNGLDSRVNINAPIDLRNNYLGQTGDFSVQANTLTIGSGGSVIADVITYQANNMNLYGSTTPVAGGEFLRGGYSGTLTQVNLTDLQNKIDQYKNASVAELLVAVGNSLFVNSPSDPVWSGIYVNGSATTKQIAANRLQAAYDKYKNASASAIYSGVLAGEIPEFGYVYDALVLKGGATAVNLNVAYAKYKQGQQVSCVTMGTCIKQPEEKKKTIGEMIGDHIRDEKKKGGDEKPKEPTPGKVNPDSLTKVEISDGFVEQVKNNPAGAIADMESRLQAAGVETALSQAGSLVLVGVIQSLDHDGLKKLFGEKVAGQLRGGLVNFARKLSDSLIADKGSLTSGATGIVKELAINAVRETLFGPSTVDEADFWGMQEAFAIEVGVTALASVLDAALIGGVKTFSPAKAQIIFTTSFTIGMGTLTAKQTIAAFEAAKGYSDAQKANIVQSAQILAQYSSMIQRADQQSAIGDNTKANDTKRNAMNLLNGISSVYSENFGGDLLGVNSLLADALIAKQQGNVALATSKFRQARSLANELDGPLGRLVDILPGTYSHSAYLQGVAKALDL